MGMVNGGKKEATDEKESKGKTEGRERESQFSEKGRRITRSDEKVSCQVNLNLNYV